MLGPQERLTQQQAERAAKGKEYNANYKPQRSKDEAKERRKAILSSIGEVSEHLFNSDSCWWLLGVAQVGPLAGCRGVKSVCAPWL